MKAPPSLLQSPFRLGAAALGVSLLIAGCGPVLSDGGGDSGGGAGGSNGFGGSNPTGGSGGSNPTGGSGGSDPTGGSGGSYSTCGAGGSVPSSTAIATPYSEIPPPDPGGSGSGTGGGAEPDPNTLYIMLRDEPVACTDPYAALDCGNHWRVTIGIPPALQAPGLIDLASPEIISTFTATGPGGGPDCYAAGGSFIDGTLEIVSIDDSEVVGVLANTTDWEFNADGQFTALRCF